jgi:type IV pilus assembly protein PilP
VQRNKEPLEAFPLDSLRFVGHMEQEGRVWAVITAPDSLVYRVEEGNYLGQNFGRISLISESRIEIREIIPNGLGGWVERDATLSLEE